MKKSTQAKKKPTQASARKAAYGAVTKAAGAARKTASASVKLPPPGYSRPPGKKVLVATSRNQSPVPENVVPANKLQAGIRTAQESISEVLQQLVEAARENYEITEIELSASFSADGKFLGFGVGGEMSITFRVKPAEA